MTPVGLVSSSSSLMVTVGAVPMVTQGLSAVMARLIALLAASTRLFTAVIVVVCAVVVPALNVKLDAPSE